MATLTLIHQGRVLGAYSFSNGVITVGSDATNDIIIPAAGIAPLHAAIQFGPGTSVLRQGDGGFPVTYNGKAVREHLLNDGDRIGISDYMLFYVEEPGNDQPGKAHQADAPGDNPPDGDAFLQWMSGSHIGRVTPLQSAMTQLGKPGQDGAAVIAKRQGGYFFSAIDQDQRVKVNHAPVGNKTIQLNHGDLLEIGKHKLQFFRES
ncbi:MAG: FHA domain-containing protein [Methylococcaceae bacterium]|nr:MAG: FHA domain-containing protein [Methylococcaceae bacterium]